MQASNTISHEIAHALRSDILSKRYRVGDRLPSERDLAARFEASRGAVRESFSQLEQLGLIRILPGGARVQAISDASLSVLGPMLELGERPDPELIDQFLEAFGALASATARSAVEKASQDEMNQLLQMVVNLANHTGDFEIVQKQWRDLFEALSEIANNLVIRLIGNDLRAQFLEHMTSLGIQSDHRRKLAAQTLRELEKSLKTGNSELAGVAISEHFAALRLAAANTTTAH